MSRGLGDVYKRQTPGTETSNIQLADSAEQTVTFKVDYIATGKATSGNVNAVTNFHINYY